MFIKENIFKSNKAPSTIRHTFTKEKIPGQMEGGMRGALCPPLNPPLSIQSLLGFFQVILIPHTLL